MSNQREQFDVSGETVDKSHVEDVAAGAGCTEIWETLSETRATNAD